MCYLIYVGWSISAIVSLVVGVMAGLYLKSSHEFVVRSLQKQLQISECLDPITDNSTTYHTIQIRVGKGNWHCRLLRLLRISVRLVVSGSIRWTPSDNSNSTGFRAHIYPLGVGRRVFKNEQNFYLIPNTGKELAVLRSELGNIYALGGFFPDIPLREDYNLKLELRNQDNQLLPELSLNNYIQKAGLIRDGETP